MGLDSGHICINIVIKGTLSAKDFKALYKGGPFCRSQNSDTKRLNGFFMANPYVDILIPGYVCLMSLGKGLKGN